MKSEHWQAIGGGLVLVGICVGSVLFFDSAKNDPDSGSGNNATSVSRVCEEAVAKELKAPSSADFDSSATGDGEWKVSGVVDAENSYGAMVRSSYTCDVTVADKNVTATVTSLG